MDLLPGQEVGGLFDIEYPHGICPAGLDALCRQKKKDSSRQPISGKASHLPGDALGVLESDEFCAGYSHKKKVKRRGERASPHSLHEKDITHAYFSRRLVISNSKPVSITGSVSRMIVNPWESI